MMELLYFLMISVFGALGIIVVSKVFLNALLRRPEDYYERGSRPAQGTAPVAASINAAADEHSASLAGGADNGAPLPIAGAGGSNDKGGERK